MTRTRTPPSYFTCHGEDRGIIRHAHGAGLAGTFDRTSLATEKTEASSGTRTEPGTRRSNFEQLSWRHGWRAHLLVAHLRFRVRGIVRFQKKVDLTMNFLIFGDAAASLA